MEDPEKHDPPDTSWIEPIKVVNLKPELPNQLLEKTLYQGCRLVVGGSPKAKKSWLMMQLCYCIANGLEFLGIMTRKGKVAYINFELLEGECRARFMEMQKAFGIGNHENIDVYQFRDRRLSTEDLVLLMDRLKNNGYVMIVFDPFYKIMPIKSELSEEMSQVLMWIEKVGAETHASTGVAQHFAKGNQALKHAIDRLSGSNWMARDADCLFILTELNEEDCQRVDVIQRSFENVRPFGIRFDHPIFKIDESINIESIKEPTKTVTGNPTEDRILSHLATCENEGGMTYTDLFKAVQVIDIKSKKSTPSKDSFRLRIKKLMLKKMVVKSGLDGKYSLSPSYAEARNAFSKENEA